MPYFLYYVKSKSLLWQQSISKSLSSLATIDKADKNHLFYKF